MSLNRVEALAQFNKINKEFIMVLERIDNIELLNHDFYLYQEVELDLDQEMITGNYDNFSIISIHDAPLKMDEDSLNRLASDKIYEKYSLEDQLSLIENTLERIADSVGVECNELKEMNDFINEIRRVNGVRKEFYANSPEYNYKTTEDLNNELAAKYDGGIHEFGTGVHDF